MQNVAILADSPHILQTYATFDFGVVQNVLVCSAPSRKFNLGEDLVCRPQCGFANRSCNTFSIESDRSCNSYRTAIQKRRGVMNYEKFPSAPLLGTLHRVGIFPYKLQFIIFALSFRPICGEEQEVAKNSKFLKRFASLS